MCSTFAVIGAVAAFACSAHSTELNNWHPAVFNTVTSPIIKRLAERAAKAPTAEEVYAPPPSVSTMYS